jgi:hypothetical protein
MSGRSHWAVQDSQSTRIGQGNNPPYAQGKRRASDRKQPLSKGCHIGRAGVLVWLRLQVEKLEKAVKERRGAAVLRGTQLKDNTSFTVSGH